MLMDTPPITANTNPVKIGFNGPDLSYQRPDTTDNTATIAAPGNMKSPATVADSPQAN